MRVTRRIGRAPSSAPSSRGSPGWSSGAPRSWVHCPGRGSASDQRVAVLLVEDLRSSRHCASRSGQSQLDLLAPPRSVP
eukprot:14457264-Heterocapsa_arctica.AAC.1